MLSKLNVIYSGVLLRLKIFKTPSFVVAKIPFCPVARCINFMSLTL